MLIAEHKRRSALEGVRVLSLAPSGLTEGTRQLEKRSRLTFGEMIQWFDAAPL